MRDPASRGRRDPGCSDYGPPQVNADGWTTPATRPPPTKAGGLSKFGKIDRSGGLQFGPSSVFSECGDERERLEKKECLEKERFEKERLEKERLENRLEQIRLAKERLAKDNADRKERAQRLPSALARARIIEDIDKVSYPPGIKASRRELNVNAASGKFR